MKNCLYCGTLSHFVSFCPLKRPGSLAVARLPFCHAQCLKSVQPAPGRLPGGSEGAPDLSAIPEEIQDLREVFNKARATSLLPHRPYDCWIDLLSSTTPLWGQLHSLLRPETKAMDTYIGDSLAAGLICPSSSPNGAWFFFVEKKDKTLAPVHQLPGTQWNNSEEPLPTTTHLLDLQASPGGHRVFQAGSTERLPPGADTGGG
jgi:hypothetical protein